jgi:MoxR-like ATPase
MTPNKFLALEKELNDGNLERAEVVRGLLVALLAKKHVLLLGPPGTGKSMLAEDLCSRIDGGQFFDWLLSRTSTPEELFGPISLKALENDSYKRVTTGKLPEATIAFLDEIWVRVVLGQSA